MTGLLALFHEDMVGRLLSSLLTGMTQSSHVQVDIMEAKFKEFMGNEAERLDRDVQHADEKSAAEAESRAARRRAEWRAICQSRDQQLNARKAQKQATLNADKAFAAAWKACVMTPALSVFMWNTRILESFSWFQHSWLSCLLYTSPSPRD